MKGYWVIPVVFGIALMLTISVLPAMADHPQGEIVWLNPTDKVGKIVKDNHCLDNDFAEYVFAIPHDLSDPSYEPKVGDTVHFTINPENSRHVTDVTFGTIASSGCF